MRVKWGIKRYAHGVLVALVLVAVAACGGDEEGGGELSADDRLGVIEARLDSFQDYIIAQAQKETEQQSRPVMVEVSDEAGTIVSTTAYIAPPLYSLPKENASENEREIVLYLADCGARTYLNPNLPKEVIDREIAESEDRMWDALESGQYSSFEMYIGMAFRFCEAKLVEEATR